MTTTTDIKLDEKIKQKVMEPKKWKVILLNDDHTPMDFVVGILTEVFKHSDLGRTSLPSMTDGFIGTLQEADVVVGAPTTLMLEAMLMGRPCVIDLTTDPYHRTTASNAAKHFVHMHDLLAVPKLDAGKTIPELLAAIDALLAKDADSVDYDIDYLYNTAEAPYGEQLLAFLSAQN